MEKYFFELAKTFYYTRIKKTSSTKSLEGDDYFSTPEPLGLKMVQWAGLKAGQKVLEPSAGHGAIARWFPKSTKNYVVECSPHLIDKLRSILNGEVYF